jgi:hypothetical protein
MSAQRHFHKSPEVMPSQLASNEKMWSDVLYQHTQAGFLVRGLIVLLILISLAALFFALTDLQHPDMLSRAEQDDLLHILGVLFVILVVLLLFHNLTVVVYTDHIYIYFGIGIIGRRIWFDNVISCKPVRNPWWYGWGIHRYPGGWVYNIHGLDAVELELKKGAKVRIGTDEPLRLAEIIDNRLAGNG